MKTWSTTVIRTRILMKDNIRIGHVRNTGRKEWYAEYYSANESEVFDTLIEAKDWLEIKT